VGKAAYDRGSRLIRRQIAQEYGTSPPPEDYRPTPRPESWGSKAAARARAKADGIIRGALRYGRPVPSLEVLAGATAMSAGVGTKTAERAAREALEARRERAAATRAAIRGMV